MPWDRQTRGLSQRKQEKPQIKKHKPLNSEGNDGDIAIRQLSDGVFLYFKALGRWYKTLNTSSQAIPEPSSPRSLALGASGQPVESMYVSSNSLHIGNTKANTLKLGIVGTGENVRLQAKTPSGNVVPDTSVNLQQLHGGDTVVLTLTDSDYGSINLTLIESDAQLEVGNGATFTIVNENDIENSEQTDTNTTAVSDLEDRVAALEALVGSTELSSNTVHKRIDNRLEFEARLWNQISILNTKYNWLKSSLAATIEREHNQLLDKLAEKRFVTRGEHAESSINVDTDYASFYVYFSLTVQSDGSSAAHTITDNPNYLFNGVYWSSPTDILIYNPGAWSMSGGVLTINDPASSTFTAGQYISGSLWFQDLTKPTTVLTDSEVSLLKIESIYNQGADIGGIWSFGAADDDWTSTEAHGLVAGSLIKFTSIHPSEANPFMFVVGGLDTIWEVITLVSSTKVKLGVPGSGTAEVDNRDSAFPFRMTTQPWDGYAGFQQSYTQSYSGLSMVEDEDYSETTSGICSDGTSTTQGVCEANGGTWYGD